VPCECEAIKCLPVLDEAKKLVQRVIDEESRFLWRSMGQAIEGEHKPLRAGTKFSRR